MVPTRRKKVGWSGEEIPVSRDQEKNKATVRKFFEEVWNRGNVAAADEILAPDFVDRSLLPGQEPSREGYKRSIIEFRAAFSFADLTIESQVAEGDMVVTKFSTRCIHRGEFLGVPPSGEEANYASIRIHRMAGGRITDEWSEGNLVEWIMPFFEREIRARERIDQDLRVARSIQQASLPEEVPELEGWHLAPYYRSAREVGGDFYDFHLLPDGKLGLAVGDATGKGVPAALVMSTTCGMLRLATQSFSSPGEILARVNEALCPTIPPNMFVTCFYAILDPERGSLTYANAGHDLPFVQRDGNAEELRARGMPLGLMPRMSYEEKEIMLNAGEAVFFYTDGLVEAHNAGGEMFGFSRLRTLISEHDGEGRLEGFLLEELNSFVGEDWEQEDDITLLTLRFRPPHPTTPPRDAAGGEAGTAAVSRVLR
jgi:serine phosphatase RsbU (regulator of sigma subunit)/predicted ester cyclase